MLIARSHAYRAKRWTIAAMNGTELDGRAILVRFDRQQTTEE